MEIFTLIILFALCAILLAIELFVFPGISIAGIAAACCLVGANYVAFSWFGLTTGLWACAASIVACGLLGYWLMHSKTLEKYSLHKSIDSTAASAEQLSVRPGDEGVAITRSPSSVTRTSAAGPWKSNRPTVSWTKALP